jgi:hypothetical protein
VPKRKPKRKASNAAYVAQTENSTSALKKRVIKWASISVILAILMSLMIAAISVSPSSAATPTTEPTVCAPIDTDGDAITNDVDSDIDGDEIVNGLDEDIDGDGILNVKDSDPAATNCGADAPPPATLIVDEPETAQEPTVWIASFVIAALGVGYILLRRIRRRQK